jgi:hypothetical protein
MPSNIIVNKMTTQHKASFGITSCFPDVCKTPAPPAPAPVPIPYPNVANSPMASVKVSKRVKDNDQKVMLKGSAYALSNGDQAGVALGVVSSKIMGKSVIKNQSFNVKFEKKGVGRLKDPHGNNSGSNPNGIAPMQGQPPAVGMSAEAKKAQDAACERLAGAQVPENEWEKTANDHGMTAAHAEAISETCVETGVSATMRETNKKCLETNQREFATKPSGASGKSISDSGNLPTACEGMVGIKGDDGQYAGVNGTLGLIPADKINYAKSKLNHDEFMDYMKGQGAYTGDYDMHDMFDNTGQRVTDGSDGERSFTNAANDAMGRTDEDTRMIQHGPQANMKEHMENNPGKADKLRKDLGEKTFEDIQKPDVRGNPAKGKLLHFDANGNMYQITNEDELKDLYACKGAEYPEHW